MPFALTNAVASISGCESSNFFSCECVALLQSISFGLRKPLTKHVATTGFMLSRFSLNDRSKLCTVNIAPQEFPQFNGGDILKSPHKVSFFLFFLLFEIFSTSLLLYWVYFVWVRNVHSFTRFQLAAFAGSRWWWSKGHHGVLAHTHTHTNTLALAAKRKTINM